MVRAESNKSGLKNEYDSLIVKKRGNPLLTNGLRKGGIYAQWNSTQP
jgi:hypothetical protein